jgi:Ca2+-binding EF-hand superfamily protein
MVRFNTFRRGLAAAAAPALLWLAAGPTADIARAADEPAKPANPENAQLFKKLDANADGQIAKDEVPEEQRRLLERLIRNSDKNGDGKLSSDEFAAGLAEERPKSEAGAGAPGGPGGGRPGAGGQFDPGQFFRMMDRNGDGKVTPDEVPEERRERFKENLGRIDENKDGAASLEEFQKGFGGRLAGRPNSGTPGSSNPGNPNPGNPNPPPGAPPMPGPAGPVLAALDADRDGELSADEISRASDALKKLDRDRDGKLTRMEIAPRPQMAGGNPGTPGAQGERPDGARMLAYFKQQDKDGDGKLSKDEVGERMRENFDRIDGNSDGKLDDTELKQMVERFSNAAGRPGARPEGGRPEGGRPGARPEGGRPGEGRPEGERPAQGRKPEASDRPQ